MAFVRLIAIAKDEGAYLAEWVHHHLYFGFDQIAVILNGCSDNSRQQLERIALRDPRLLVRDGDPLKTHCQVSGQNFQIAAYAEELALARQDGRVTHVMCLDIDEFWVTPGLQDSIHTFAERYPDADSIAFAWHMEVPSHPDTFTPALTPRYAVQKNQHVKSLNRVSERLQALGIHNADHLHGRYLLSDGSEFAENITEGASRALLPKTLFARTSDAPDIAYIYHRLFRSETEYLASLQRGRPNQQVPLKDNRWGYRCETQEIPVLAVAHSETAVQALRDGHAAFLQEHGLIDLIRAAQAHTAARAQATIGAFENPTPEVCQLTFLFAGLESLPEPGEHYAAHIAHHIDSVRHVNGSLVINGWAIDRNSRRPVHLALNENVQATVTRWPRPDVHKHYPGCHPESGFRLEVAGHADDTLALTLRCGHTSQTHSLPLPLTA